MKKTLVLFAVVFLFVGNAFDAFAGDVEKSLSHDLSECAKIVRRIEDSFKSGVPVTDDITLLKKSAESIHADRLLLAERHGTLAERAAILGGTPSDRQGVVSSTLIQNLDELLSHLDSVGTSVTSSDLETLQLLLDTLVPKRSRPLLGALPYKHTNYPPREPASSPEVKPAYNGGDRTVYEADTAASPEAPLSKEIVELSRSLQWNPVLIYEWVKNNVETEWYWGSMKGAEETLRQKSGNDADQASLLVALLRAANFPARYVKGTIDFFPDIDRAKNLIGLDDPLKMADFFRKAGIPFKPVVSGGGVSNFQIEHIWVEAFIPYANYRGAVVDDQGKIWLGLDTSIKPQGYTRSQGVGVPADLLATLRDDYLNGVQTLTPLEYLTGKLDEQLALNQPGKTWNDLKDTAVLVPDVLKIIPDGMQFNQSAITGEYQTLPDELKHRLTFTATVGSSELFTITLDAQKLSNRKVALRAEPETVEDQNTIDSFGGLDNSPAYLVRLRPVLTLDGERLIVAQDGLPMGAEFTLNIDLVTPTATERISSSQINGNLSVIGVVSQKAQAQTAITDTDNAEAILHKEAIGYIDRWNRGEDNLAALLGQRISRPAVTIAIVGGQMEVTTLLDITHDMQWKGLYLDAGYRRVETTGRNGQERDFMRLSALHGSILENRIFEDDLKVDSISTAKLLQQAKTNGISIVTIDKTSIDANLSTLPFDDAVKEDIINAVNQGLTVTIPQEETAYQNWTGIGYIKEDLATGESGWMLSGNVAGGMTAVKKDEWVLQDLANTLAVPNNAKPNNDPSAVRKIVRITASDYQEGIAGKTLTQPFMALALDDSGMPVANVTLVFRSIAGGGVLGADAAATAGGGVSEYLAKTGSNGIARAFFMLGKKTSDSPYYVQKNQPYAIQLGQNLVDVRANAPGGVIAVDKPFEAYGYPGDAIKIIKVAEAVTDNKYGLPGLFAGSVWVQVADENDNPVSNKQVTFSIRPQSYRVSPPPFETPDAKILNAKLLPTENTCLGTPSLECAQCAEQLPVFTSIAGSNAQVILGNTEGTDFFIEARAFKDENGKETDMLIDPVTFTYHSYGITEQIDSRAATYLTSNIIYHFDSRGNRIDAGKAGTLFPQPLAVTLYRSEEATIAATKDNCTSNCYCLKGTGIFQTNRIDSGAVRFTTPGNGSVSPAVVPEASAGQPAASVANGMYETRLTLGLEPGRNTVIADGSALLPVKQINTSSGEVFTSNHTLIAQATFDIWGVLPKLEPDLWILINSKGFPTSDIPLKLSVNPLEYPVGTMSVRFFENDQYMGEVPVQRTGGVLSSGGAVFKTKSAYYAKLSLFDTAMESDPVPIKVVSVDAAIDSDNTIGLNPDGTHKDPVVTMYNESIEDTPGLPGKLLPINDRDRNGDGIPDFADGYDLTTPQPAENSSAPLIPIILVVPEPIDTAQALLRFSYNASDPAGVTRSSINGKTTYTPAPGGNIRIWTKDGITARLKASAANDGNYIKSGEILTIAQLGTPIGPRTWRFYIEGVLPSIQLGEELIRVDIDPDGAGDAPFMIADEVRATVNKAVLITDFNHDRIINDTDGLRAAIGNTYYFWVNDDNDSGETEGSDIPGSSTPNDKDVKVNGMRDLEDFFPVQLNIQDLLQKFPPDSYNYVLKQADSALNLVFASLRPEESGTYLTDASDGGVAKRLADKDTFQIKAEGVVLNNHTGDPQFLQNILLNNTGIILVEGRDETPKPLVLDIIDKSGKLVLTSSLNISIAGVENMFRQKNLMQEMFKIDDGRVSPPEGVTSVDIVNHKVPNEGASDRLGMNSEGFSNYKHFTGFDIESDTNNFIHVHGYNVNGQDARGEHAEVFKRLFWSGSKAKFWGITWYGYDSQKEYKLCIGTRSPNYHVNIRHAFNAGKLLDNFVRMQGLGSATFSAHSLGNIVVSTAIQNDMPYGRYLMVNAAVAEEAYIDLASYEAGNWSLSSRSLMYNPDWRYPNGQDNQYLPFLWQSEWYKLFPDSNDKRNQLTWRNNFANVRNENVYTFFAPTDEAFRPFKLTLDDIITILSVNEYDGSKSKASVIWTIIAKWIESCEDPEVIGTYAFSYNELMKGTESVFTSWVANTDSKYGGWGFNLRAADEYNNYSCIGPDGDKMCSYITPADANVLNKSVLKTKQLFNKNSDNEALFTDNMVDATVLTTPMRERILANEIPALTFAVGHRGVEKTRINNFDIRDRYLVKNEVNNITVPWPREKYEWRHSDIFNVAYPYVNGLYNDWVKLMKGVPIQ